MYIDLEISKYLVQNINSHPAAREALSRLADANLVKGVVSAIIFWFLWFYREESVEKDRNKLCAVIAVTILSIAFGRALANFLPFRPRPQENVEVVGDNFLRDSFLEQWSSMPSDHAIMFFALAAGFSFVSKKVGYFALAHAAVIVCLPRVLVGLHYFSDIIVGAIIGILLACIFVPVLSKMVRFDRFIKKNA